MSVSNITSNSANKSKKSSRKNESSHVKRIQKVVDGIKILVTNTVIEQSSEHNVLTKLDLNDLQSEQHAVAWHNFADAKYDLLPIYYEIGSETQQPDSIQESSRSRCLKDGSQNGSRQNNFTLQHQGAHKRAIYVRLLDVLIITWNHGVSFLNMNNKQSNKRTLLPADVATTLSTMKNVVDITNTLVNRIKTVLDKRNNNKNLSDKESKRSPNSEYHEVINRLRDTFLSNFPIRRQGGVGGVPFFYIAELNASLCSALVQLGQLDFNDWASSGHNKDTSWGERISGYLSNAYLRETQLQAKHNDNKDAPKSGIIALIQVMPNIMSKVDAASSKKRLLHLQIFLDHQH